MNFTKLTEQNYKSFYNQLPTKSFLASPNYANLNPNEKILFYGVKENDKLVAAALIRGTKRNLGKYDFYIPRGPLLDYSNKPLIRFFFENLKRELKKEDGFILRFDPNLPLIERDNSGDIVENGFNNKDKLDFLLSLGAKKSHYIENISQIIWQFVLPVKGKTEDDLLKAMKPNTRRRLNQALELGLYSRELIHAELPDFYKILKETSSKKSFSVRPFSYYEKMFDLFSRNKEIAFVSVFINPKKSLDSLMALLEAAKLETPTTKREKQDRDDRLRSLTARIEKLKTTFPTIKDEEITLSSGMFMTIYPEIVHVFGGNSVEYFKLDGQYVLQWEMIRQALHENYDRYNFYGIPVNLDKASPYYGVYEFKRGFGGNVEELIGELEIPLSPLYSLSKIKKTLKRKKKS